MILHRLRLTNFRGVGDRELSFPDHGVVVVCGPNEVGKSSMLEALDLLLTYRDRSAHRDVKQVKPAHADVGAEVEAEISTGPYRFVYRKRFHKKHRTELEIIEPRRENLTGDEAHERVEAMLAETVDTKLWDAQRVLQSASTSAVNLSGCDALSRALDASAGEVEEAGGRGSDSGSLLVDRIDAEYQRYFTATGRPTKDFKSAADRLRAAEADVMQCSAAVREVDDRVFRHERLTAALADLDDALRPATARLAAARQAGEIVAELSARLNRIRQEVRAAAAASVNSGLANGQRRQLVSDVERRAATLAGLNDELAAAEPEEARARQAAEAAATSAEQTAVALVSAQERLEAARAAAQLCVERENADRLAVRLQRIDETSAKCAEVAGQLAAITLTDSMLGDIDTAAATVERLQAQLHADVANVEFTAPADLAVVVDGTPRTLAAGERWTQPASAGVVVEIPGVLAVRIDPGASTVKLGADLDAAQQVLADAVARAGVADRAAAHHLAEERQALIAAGAQLAATLDGLLGGEDVEQLRGQLARLHAVTIDVGAGADPEAAAAELTAAAEAIGVARAAAEAQRTVAAAAGAECVEKTTQTTVLRSKAKDAAAELTAVVEHLNTLRAAVSDEEVAAQAAADAEAQRCAEVAEAELAAQYAAANPDAVEVELAAAVEAVEAIDRDLETAKRELNDLRVELAVIGTEGRQGQLDEAEAELEQARAEYDRIEERARAAELLRDTMIRHRDNTRQRYVRPYRAELERLGRTVFGNTFEVGVDSELTITTRTLDGCTVPFDSLSGGAKEQLGILARLAGAALVSSEDTVPVVIDDALGFSDPDRLIKMGAVFNTVGDRGQVIVLTCQPSRYEGIAGAEVIALSK